MKLFKDGRTPTTERDLLILLKYIQTAITLSCVKSEDPDWDLHGYVVGFFHRNHINVMPDALVPGTPKGLKEAVRIMTSDPSKIPDAVFTATSGYLLDSETRVRVGEVVNVRVEGRNKQWVTATANMTRDGKSYPTLAWGYALSSFSGHNSGGVLSEYYP